MHIVQYLTWEHVKRQPNGSARSLRNLRKTLRTGQKAVFCLVQSISIRIRPDLEAMMDAKYAMLKVWFAPIYPLHQFWVFIYETFFKLVAQLHFSKISFIRKECTTTRDGVKNKSCIFPFIWEDNKYFTCIRGNDGDWCSTKVDNETGKHVHDKGQWAICDPYCMIGTRSTSRNWIG